MYELGFFSFVCSCKTVYLIYKAIHSNYHRQHATYMIYKPMYSAGQLCPEGRTPDGRVNCECHLLK